MTKYSAYLVLLHELLHELPSLLTRPWQAFGILCVISERVLAQLAHPARHNVVNGLLDSHPTAHLVHELQRCKKTCVSSTSTAP